MEAAPAPVPAPTLPACGPRGVLQQNRQFLDFFWDIAKPQQEVRLAATESLLRYLRASEQEDELKYTLKRLIEGLGATREAARPGFSLALAQVLQFFEEIPLHAVLQQIKEKHNLERVKKKLFRNAAFGNFFGVLSLFQSGRLAKDKKALLECVRLLQSLAQYHAHLRDLPRKTLVDILSEIPEAVFEEVLFSALQADLTSAFSTPEQLHLLLVGIQKFPGVLKPSKLKILLGSSAIVTMENIPRLVQVLKTAARSEKKDRNLPPVGLDLLRVSVKEGAFELFWKEAVENGLLKEKSGPNSYMCYRLLGSALPLLSLDQLQVVLRGEVMRHYGDHVVSAQLPDRFKFAPEMETYVNSFLEGCDDPEKQLAVMIGFSTLTNQGYPVVPSFWKVVKHLQPAALLKYVDWLKRMFLRPDFDCCLDFTTSRQKQNQEKVNMTQHRVVRLRKWIIARLVSIIDSQGKKEEDLVIDVVRFCFFHAFFETQKPTSEIAETKSLPSVPLDGQSHSTAANLFFSLLQILNSLPVLGDTAEAAALREKHIHGVTADRNLWLYLIIQYASVLLSHEKHVKAVTPFTAEQRAAWDRMLQSLENLQKKEKESRSMEIFAFQHLLLLVGIHLFKTPAETQDLLNDLLNCIERAFDKKSKKKQQPDDEEPEWVEVIVEILLSLLSQPSLLMRRVSKSVFGRICPYMSKKALHLILNVLDPEQDQDEESAVVVMEETDKKKKTLLEDTNKEESADSSDDDSSEEDGEEDSEDENNNEGVDENFRNQLMNVLQAGNALGGDKSDEDVDDETMLALDENVSALFAEQQKRIQAKKDEKEKMRKEKILRRDFKIKVLDLIEVFLAKQPENPLVFDIIEPLLLVIERSMSSDSDKQEQDFLRKTADIFTNHLCRAKQYCRSVGDLQEDLHALLESLVKRASKHTDSALALYYFSASLYLFKVLKGNVARETATPLSPSKKERKNSEGSSAQTDQLSGTGILDLKRVTMVYQEALSGFLTRRKSALTGSMFLDLFNRFPVTCKPLIDTLVKSITAGARQHQQAQACMLLQRALQTRDLKLSMTTEEEWEELIRESTNQISESLKAVSEFKVKVDQEKVIKCLELLNFLIKTVNRQKLNVELAELSQTLQALSQQEGFGKSVRLDSLYWNVMKLLGFARPKKEKAVARPEHAPGAEPLKRKKKGFLPATKKRKNRKKAPQENGAESSREAGPENGAESCREAGPEAGQAAARKKNRKRKGGAGKAGAEGPSPKKAKGSHGQETQGKQGKAKKKKKANKTPAQKA
ncbi:myb-binding protein 1A [Malaclemys terrapin pileata]|uniref:myb-binding protein 1A n=1 Tax=Malaclemys terrapin pileata TaxID=2991368 RepID=UPI0023A79360|nr:myb-binding protein 1A [Malaclemys terrapin pileata]